MTHTVTIQHHPQRQTKARPLTRTNRSTAASAAVPTCTVGRSVRPSSPFRPSRELRSGPPPVGAPVFTSRRAVVLTGGASGRPSLRGPHTAAAPNFAPGRPAALRTVVLPLLLNDNRVLLSSSTARVTRPGQPAGPTPSVTSTPRHTASVGLTAPTVAVGPGPLRWHALAPTRSCGLLRSAPSPVPALPGPVGSGRSLSPGLRSRFGRFVRRCSPILPAPLPPQSLPHACGVPGPAKARAQLPSGASHRDCRRPSGPPALRPPAAPHPPPGPSAGLRPPETTGKVPSRPLTGTTHPGPSAAPRQTLPTPRRASAGVLPLPAAGPPSQPGMPNPPNFPFRPGSSLTPPTSCGTLHPEVSV